MTERVGWTIGKIQAPAEKQTPFQGFVDKNRGVIGYGLTYGVNSYNGRPISDAARVVRVVDSSEISKIQAFLEDAGPVDTGETPNNADWKDRFQKNSERMRTGSLLDIAAVLKSLLILSQSKPLSFREKKMLERARYLLVSELAISRGCEENLVEEALTKALDKCHLRFPETSELQS